jgi:hypothetical protein
MVRKQRGNLSMKVRVWAARFPKPCIALPFGLLQSFLEQ